MKPGDMVLYESHSLIHGRPFPLKGRFFANIFIHFEPTGNLIDSDGKVTAQKRSLAASESGLPIYIQEHSQEADLWLRRNGITSSNKVCTIFSCVLFACFCGFHIVLT